MAGLTPAAVICEIMKDDGTMARLPDLHRVRARARPEDRHHRRPDPLPQPARKLVERVGRAHRAHRARRRSRAIAFRDKPSGGAHLALVHGAAGRRSAKRWCACTSRSRCSTCWKPTPPRTRGTWRRRWPAIQAAERGVVVLLNCGEIGGADVRAVRRRWTTPTTGRSRAARRMDLRTYGIGAQILRDLGVRQDEAAGQSAQDASHDRLQPGSGRLSECAPNQ